MWILIIKQWLKSAAVPGLVVGLVVGLVAGNWLFSPVQQIADTVKQKKEESFRPAIVHKSGTVTLERSTGNIPPKIPQSSIPGTVKRYSEIKIQPASLEPVTVQVVQSEDETGTRATVQAEGGEILEGKEIVIPQKFVIPKNLHWSAHILAKFGRNGREWGAMAGSCEA